MGRGLRRRWVEARRDPAPRFRVAQKPPSPRADSRQTDLPDLRRGPSIPATGRQSRAYAGTATHGVEEATGAPRRSGARTPPSWCDPTRLGSPHSVRKRPGLTRARSLHAPLSSLYSASIPRPPRPPALVSLVGPRPCGPAPGPAPTCPGVCSPGGGGCAAAPAGRDSLAPPATLRPLCALVRPELCHPGAPRVAAPAAAWRPLCALLFRWVCAAPSTSSSCRPVTAGACQPGPAGCPAALSTNTSQVLRHLILITVF